MPGRRRAAAQLSAVPDQMRGDGGGLPSIRPVSAGVLMRWMLYAYPGHGKTSLIAELAQMGQKVLMIRTPMDQVPKRAINSGVEEAVVTDWSGMLELQDYLRMSDHGYDWVWWDNVSVDQDVLLDDVWEATVAEKPGRAYKLDQQGKIAGMNLSPTSGLDKGEFGRNMERIQQWVRHIVGANSFHFGMTAHPFEGPHPTDNEGGMLLQPYVQGKNMSSKLCGYCNLVSFLEVVDEKGDGEITRRLHFRENPRFYAKDLFDAFEEGRVDDPNMPDIIKAVTAAQKGQATKPPARRGRRRREQ
jgi:hypothetical protein